MQEVNIYMPVMEPTIRLLRRRVGAYKVTLLTPLRPVRGLVWSVLIHAAVILSLPFLSRLLPETRISLRAADPFQDRYEPLELPTLPATNGSGASGGKSGGVKAASAPAGDSLSRDLPETVYAGPQEIVSHFRRASNTVQTIRRPDLVKAPKLKFPIRVQSMVLLTLPIAQPKLVAPAPQPTSSEKLAAKTEAVEKPVIAVHRYESRRKTAVDSGPPKVTAKVSGEAPVLVSTKTPLPVLRREVELTATQSAVVINAVSLPPEIPKTVPNAEVTGNFAVLRMTTAIAPDPPATNANGDPVSDGSVTATWEPGRMHIPKSGNGGGAGNSGSGPGTGSGGSGSGKTGSGDGLAIAAGGAGSSGGNGIPGISIVGGSSAPPHLPTREAVVRPGPNYDLMILSSGSSGGASRDLGIFDHSHAVYTVYITMSDAGGGPDWSMQYALVGQSQEGEGLLVPPMPWKKVPVVTVQGQRRETLTQFVAATIDANGEPGNVRAVGSKSSRAELAVETLKQWRFTPAELNGKPQAIQVLVGVVLPNNATSPSGH